MPELTRWLSSSQFNLRWVRLGCALVETLLTNADGIAFLAGDPLLPQLCDCLTELDQVRALTLDSSSLCKC